MRLKDGVEVWRGRMDETQRPLSENLFKIGSFFRRKAKWVTAEELASVGMDEALRKLPGATELEEKKP
jgi:ribulose 1,5-bisphosphate carboxylase large subunit-like protein